jgi:hypothetical protein
MPDETACDVLERFWGPAGKQRRKNADAVSAGSGPVIIRARIVGRDQFGNRVEETVNLPSACTAYTLHVSDQMMAETDERTFRKALSASMQEFGDSIMAEWRRRQDE